MTTELAGQTVWIAEGRYEFDTSTFCIPCSSEEKAAQAIEDMRQYGQLGETNVYSIIIR